MENQMLKQILNTVNQMSGKLEETNIKVDETSKKLDEANTKLDDTIKKVEDTNIKLDKHIEQNKKEYEELLAKAKELKELKNK